MDVRHAAYVGSALGRSDWARWIGDARAAWTAACARTGQDPARWVESGWRWTAPDDAHITLFYDLHGRAHSSVLVAMACARLGPLPPLPVVRTHWWTGEARSPAVWAAELDVAPWNPWLDELQRIGWRHHRDHWVPHITLGKADSHTQAAVLAHMLHQALPNPELLPRWRGEPLGPWEPMSTHLRKAPRHR